MKEEQTKAKEVFKRVDPKLLTFRCACGGQHFVSFCMDVDEFEDSDGTTAKEKSYTVLVEDPLEVGLWRRIKDAVRYILGKRGLYFAEIYLCAEDLKKIKEHINKYLAL